MPNFRRWECGSDGLLINKLLKVGVWFRGLLIAKLQKVGVWFRGFDDFQTSKGGSVVQRV